MAFKNATVALTYKLGGVLLSHGKYEYKERTTSGNLLEEDRRLFVTKRPTYADCHMSIILNESFVNHAISDDGRPEDHSKASFLWKKMTEQQRLEYYITQYVKDMDSDSYSFEILMQ